MVHFDLNWWAVLAAAIINMAVGAAWYSPALFGKAWAALLGKKIGDMGGNANTGYAVTTLAAVVQAFVLANIIIFTQATTLYGGLKIGLMLWVGFAAATSISDYVFAGRPWKLFVLNQGYYFVVILINSAVFAVWR